MTSTCLYYCYYEYKDSDQLPLKCLYVNSFDCVNAEKQLNYYIVYLQHCTLEC